MPLHTLEKQKEGRMLLHVGMKPGRNRISIQHHNR